MSRIKICKSIQRFAVLVIPLLVAAAGNGPAPTRQFTASAGDLVVTSVVAGTAQGFSDSEALALMRRGVERGLHGVKSPYTVAPVYLRWTIRDSGRPARAYVDVFVAARDGQPARHASDSVAASAAPAAVFVQAIAGLTERALDPPRGSPSTGGA
jgi:hypothetical protein